LRASIVGSSWNNAEASGLAPIRSPAPTVIVLEFAVRSVLTCVARKAAPPATTFTPAEFRMVPGVVGWMWPWKSLIASSCTCVSLSFGPLAASAPGTVMPSAAASTATKAAMRLIRSSPVSKSFRRAGA
jgi:hypothetical protein